MPAAHFNLTVDLRDAGLRLDQLVSGQINDISRSAAAGLIRRGAIMVDGAARKAGYRVRPGETVTGTIPDPAPAECRPEPIDFGILYEDSHLIVIDKPADLVVHPAPGHTSGTLVNGLIYHCPDLGGIGGEIRPGIVHRLDKDTTGVMAVAKHEKALEALAKQFRERRVEKEYIALVRGIPKEGAGRIGLPIGRHPVDRKKMSTTSRHPRPAETAWEVMHRFDGASLMRVNIMTGRTHQIRVHLAGAGLPIVGDRVYGPGKGAGGSHPGRIDAPRQMLHAHKLSIDHPFTGKRCCFTAPMPTDMALLIQRLSGSGK